MFGGGSDDSYAPAPDPKKPLFKPIVTEEPESESFNDSPPGAGHPGDVLPSGSMPYGLQTTQAQEQSVKDDRGTVTTFVSDLPQK
jgi:hypothetical protein